MGDKEDDITNFINLTIKTPKKTYTISTNANDKVVHFIEKFATENNLLDFKIQMVFAGRILKDLDILKLTGLKNDCVIHAVIKNKPTDEGCKVITKDDKIEKIKNTGIVIDGVGSGKDGIGEMLDNPKFKGLFKRNPDLKKAIEETSKSSEFGFLQNPNTIGEVMRQYDRSISKIENMPGGIHLLEKMYNDVHSPMFNVGRGSQYRKSITGNYNPEDERGKFNCQPIPNIWEEKKKPKQHEINNLPDLGVKGLYFKRPTNPKDKIDSVGSSRVKNIPSTSLQKYSDTITPKDTSYIYEEIINNPSIITEALRSRLKSEHLDSGSFDNQTNNDANLPISKLTSNDSDSEKKTKNTRDFELINKILKSSSIPSISNEDNSVKFITEMFETLRTNPTPTTAQERYSNQLEQLRRMGFENDKRNLEALIISEGDLSMAVNILLGDMESA